MDDRATISRQPLKVGLAGLGLVGGQVVALFRDRKPPGLTLHGVAVRNVEAGRAELDVLGMARPILPLSELVREVDVVVEATRAESLREVLEATLGADKTAVIVSGAGLLQCQDLLEQSVATGRGRVILASGALPGLDAVRSAAEAGITSLRVQSYFTIPNIEGHLKTMGIDASQLTEPLVFFRGSAREAAKLFPRHFNIGMALQIACGVGMDFEIEMLADPTSMTPTNRIEIETPAGGYTLEARSVLALPTRGSRLVAPSIMACLRRLADPLSAGS